VNIVKFEKIYAPTVAEIFESRMQHSILSGELQIGERTLSNFGRCVAYEDRLEAYYDMEQNPWSELCDTYWNILMQQILTQN
jgi:hypothetical protein